MAFFGRLKGIAGISFFSIFVDVVGATVTTAAAAAVDDDVVVVVDSCALAESFLAFFLLLTFGDSTKTATDGSFTIAAVTTVVGFSWLTVGLGISTVETATTGAVTSFFATTGTAATGCFDLEFYLFFFV